MNLFRLVVLELWHRRFGFALAVLTIAAATAATAGILTALAAYDMRTERLAQQRQLAVEANMSQLQEDFRKLTLKMGFTTVIVHRDQNLADLFAKGFATTYMPEAYGDKIAAAKVTTINHVLPTLQQRINWTEQNLPDVQLIGAKGEVYVQSKIQMPLLDRVPENGVVIGQQIQAARNLKVGDEITMLGHKLTVTGIRPGNGGAEDVGLWINLPLAQQILSHPGQINAIMAVECMCPGDRVSVIQREIGSLLPDVKVFEFVNVASARSEARRRVNDAAATAAQQERDARAADRREKETLGKFLIPSLLAATLVAIGFLTLASVRERRAEIGILRAIGVRSWQVAALFLTKAAVSGFLGVAIGYPVGRALGLHWSRETLVTQLRLGPLPLGLALLLGGIGLAIFAAVIPALIAARQHPAIMLREE